ncbi:hemicentin-1-like isoform X2 [Gadus chalcogrammus]|uniref:hemicentin-1-like isoform X2 n=1 Tax=Gadus chalcogrammus TaxID=1042646 RepID=UPI0024C4CE74|nr:hemicentin-1-like isoform X2 [Gadus chalcogrammus]
MIWWTPIVVVGLMLLKRDSLCQGFSFKLIETNVTAKEGECVQIECISDYISDKSPIWFWFKNANFNTTFKKFQGYTLVYNSSTNKVHQDFEGRVTVGSPKSPYGNKKWDLEICCLRMSDSGNYSFRYEGVQLFHTEPVAKLQVNENPCKVSFQTSKTYLNESDVAVFNCSTASSLCGKRPNITGLPTHAHLNRNSSTSTVARLTVVSTDNQTVLSCGVPGLIDECVRQNVTLTVQYTPRKPVLSGTGKNVTLGESLTLTCSAEAFPAPTVYTWFLHKDWKNGTTHSPGWLNGTSNDRLEIEGVTRADHGCYHCSASNLLGRGEDSSSYCVEVLFAPALPVLSMVKLATEGEEITIRCNVESWPLPSSLNLSWSSTKDLSMHHLLHRVSNAASLTKRLNVTSASAGRYTCRAQNTQGSNQLETDLTVNYAPQNVSVTAKSLELTEGNTLELFCEAKSFPTVSNYSWTRTRTSTGQEEVVGSDQKLNLMSVTSADHGGYRCRAQNLVGSRVSREVGVTVKYAPKNATITVLSGQVYDAGAPIQLSCRSTSYPPVNWYKWYKKLNNFSNVEPVPGGQNLTVRPDHPGIYHCYASNEIGGTDSNPVRLFLNTRHLVEILWAIPFVCILVLAVIIYLVCRHKRKKLVSEGSPDPLSCPVTPITDACGSRDDLLPNQGRSHTCHAFSQAPLSTAAGAERLSDNDTVYSTVKLPTGKQPIRGDHSYAGDEVNYASLHFPTQGLQGCSPPAAMENDVYSKIANKNYENLDEEDNQMVDIELNYSQVTFMAKKTKTRKTKKTTR